MNAVTPPSPTRLSSVRTRDTCGGVTRFVVDTLGTRQAVALYVQGVKQQVPYVSDDREIHANGAGHGLRVQSDP